MNRLTRWLVIGLLGMVSTVALANSIRVERDDEGPVTVVVNRENERAELELDPDNPDWQALDSALEGLPEAARWRSMIESVLTGEGPLTLALHDHKGVHKGVRIVRMPDFELEIETEALSAEMAELHAHMAEQSARLEEEAARIEAHVAKVVIPKIVMQHRDKAAEAIAEMIRQGEFSAEELSAIQEALSAKSASN
ncbi:hypothetical protein [Ferrimonas balearica]|uniref:hypothetical protein n=1 Tax=Ferrimonas balearica TaxID=44012 RepID=UPI001C99F0AB|nr:hypothetical protein [Ferrimonas balearica]MBY5922057.1 hypothetical protein [Ferrimonas balearica]MBY5994603.1 hypothetical protein [Ferrimonas balearica]